LDQSHGGESKEEIGKPETSQASKTFDFARNFNGSVGSLRESVVKDLTSSRNLNVSVLQIKRTSLTKASYLQLEEADYST